MINLSSHQLHIFIVAAETLNFTHAAQLLDMTQPSVSQHIQALEDHFGMQLFMRSGRSIEITDAGIALLPLAREMVYFSNHIEETMVSLKGDVYGHLIVGCSGATGRYILPKLLASFHRIYPQVRATCHVTPKLKALEMLSEGKVHLVLTTNPPVCQDVDFREFTTERIVLIVPAGHPWAERGEIELTELQEADFIMPDEGMEIHSALREALAGLDFSIYRLKPVIALGSLESIALSVMEGLGVGFVPLLVADRLVPGKVVTVKVKGLDICRSVNIGRSTHRPRTASQEAFWEFLLDPENPVLESLSNNGQQLVKVC